MVHGDMLETIFNTCIIVMYFEAGLQQQSNILFVNSSFVTEVFSWPRFFSILFYLHLPVILFKWILTRIHHKWENNCLKALWEDFTRWDLYPLLVQYVLLWAVDWIQF